MAIKNKSTRSAALPKSFERLVRSFPPMVIRDDIQHGNTIEVIDRLMAIEKPSQDQVDYLETLVELVKAYEVKHHSIDVSKTTGLQTLRHIIDQSGLSGSDLARLLGVHATMGSKIINGERRLTWEHAKKLGAKFKVTPALFMD